MSIGWPNDDQLQGRILTVRTRRRGRDLTHISAYFPPILPNGQVSDMTVKLFGFLRKVLWSLPRRTTPILCVDANARTGIASDPGDFGFNIGNCQPNKENANGTVFRRLLHDTNLCALNTFSKNVPSGWMPCSKQYNSQQELPI